MRENMSMMESITQPLEAQVETLELGQYLIDLVKIEDFKNYYYKNLDFFSKAAYNSYLKAVDIPPKFFKEQPLETQAELIENRDTFVREHKKYVDKVIVVARNKVDNQILNCSRMKESEAKSSYERLKPIDQVVDKFEHRSFTKDGYITYVISADIKHKVENKVLVVDFPITLNKKTVIHNALYSLPDETFVTPVEHIQYLTGEELDFDSQYDNVKTAIDIHREFLTEERTEAAEKDILREPEVVALALVEAGYIPHSYVGKIGDYIKNNTKGTLTTRQLEKLVLDYDETFRSYKQVTMLRNVNGDQVSVILDSDDFRELIDEMESTLEVMEEL